MKLGENDYSSVPNTRVGPNSKVYLHVFLLTVMYSSVPNKCAARLLIFRKFSSQHVYLDQST